MFTGQVESTAIVSNIETKRGQLRMSITTDHPDLTPGESIAINGVCLQVAEATAKGEALLFVSEEIMEKSNLKALKPESIVNIERALTLQSRLSGHMIQGNVDTTAILLNHTDMTDNHKLTFAADPKFGRYCVEQGFISFNGVSLTIHSQQITKQGEFIVSVLVSPLLWKRTNLKHLKPGEHVNVEVDILAKYVERLFNHFQGEKLQKDS